eukprot:COSAG02_NODE_6642_length_3441_cov_3.462597_1_plen_90_part_00
MASATDTQTALSTKPSKHRCQRVLLRRFAAASAIRRVQVARAGARRDVGAAANLYAYTAVRGYMNRAPEFIENKNRTNRELTVQHQRGR